MIRVTHSNCCSAGDLPINSNM